MSKALVTYTPPVLDDKGKQKKKGYFQLNEEALSLFTNLEKNDRVTFLRNYLGTPFVIGLTDLKMSYKYVNTAYDNAKIFKSGKFFSKNFTEVLSIAGSRIDFTGEVCFELVEQLKSNVFKIELLENNIFITDYEGQKVQ